MFVILLPVNYVWAPFTVPHVRERSIWRECRNIHDPLEQTWTFLLPVCNNGSRVITTPLSASASFLRCFSGESPLGLVANLASSIVSSPSPSPDSNWLICTIPIHRHDLRCDAKTMPLDSEQIQCPQYGGLQNHCLELSGTEPRTQRSTITVPSLAPARMNGVSMDACLSLD